MREWASRYKAVYFGVNTSPDGKGVVYEPGGLVFGCRSDRGSCGNFVSPSTMAIWFRGGAPSDDTPPTISVDIDGELGNDGWYTSDVTVTWTVTDDESDVTKNGCEYQTVTSDTAGVTFTCTVESAGGSDSASVTIKRDATAPTTTTSVSSGPNDNGWNNTDVTVSFAATDVTPGSGVKEIYYSVNGTPRTTAGATASTLLSDDGEYTVLYYATDNAGNSSEPTEVTVKIDQTAPEISVSMSPAVLWPPNHKMVDVAATVSASDATSGIDSVTLVSAASSEPDNGKGDGNTVDDIQGADIGTEDYEMQLRAERSGGGPGRIYTITYEAMDLAGNTASAEATVTVPHDRGKCKGNGKK